MANPSPSTSLSYMCFKEKFDTLKEQFNVMKRTRDSYAEFLKKYKWTGKFVKMLPPKKDLKDYFKKPDLNMWKARRDSYAAFLKEKWSTK